MTATAAPARGRAAAVRQDIDQRTAANLRMAGLMAPVGVLALQALPAVGPLCPLRRTTGVPCPLCGMTTGADALLRGDVPGALAANPLVPVLAVLVVAAWLVLLAGRAALPVRTTTIGRTLIAALPGLWLFQLHRYDLI